MESPTGKAQALAGGEHTLYHSENGEVFSFGACGLGWNRLKTLSSWPKDNGSSTGLFASLLAPGYYHNLAVSPRGHVYSWGCGTFPEGKGEGSKPALGQGTAAEDKGAFPSRVKGIQSTATAAACGAYHSVVLTSSGSVLTFGAAQLGQLGRSAAQGATDASGLPIDATPREVEGLPPRELDPVRVERWELRVESAGVSPLA